MAERPSQLKKAQIVSCKIRFFYTVLGALCLFAASAPCLYAAETTVSVGAEPVTVQQGTTVAVPIRITDVTGLYGFEVLLKFDPAVVQVADADPAKAGVQLLAGDFLALDFLVRNTVDNAAGTAEFVLAQLNPSEAKSGTGTLFTVLFEGVAAGKTTAVTIDRLKLASRDGLEIAALAVNGDLTVAAATSAAPPASPTLLPTAVPPVLDMDILTATPLPTALQPAAQSPTTTPLPAATATPADVSGTPVPAHTITAQTPAVTQPAVAATATELLAAPAATVEPTMGVAEPTAAAATADSATPTTTVIRIAAQGGAPILDGQAPQPSDAAPATGMASNNHLLLAGGGLIALASVALAGILILRGRARQP